MKTSNNGNKVIDVGDPALPLVSIITPCFNSAKFIEQTIISISDQTYKNIEYIIVDGGSTDGTLEIIKKYISIVSILIVESDDGMYQAINKGINRANGSIVAYINSDDKYFPDAIELIVKCFLANKTVDLIYGNMVYIDYLGKVLFRQKYPEFLLGRLIVSNFCMIGQPASFWRRSLHDKVGLFNCDFKMAADYEFFIRSGLHGKILHMRHDFAFFRVHDSALSFKNKSFGQHEVKQIQEIHIKNPSSLRLIFLRAYYSLQFKFLNFDSICKRLFIKLRSYYYAIF